MTTANYTYTDEQIERAKGVDIVETWNREVGIPLIKEGPRFKAESNPFREECNPSLYVGGYQRNFVIDYGDNNKGYTTIDLVMHGRGCNFIEAVRVLLVEYLGDCIPDLEPDRTNGTYRQTPARSTTTTTPKNVRSTIPVGARETDYKYLDLAGQPRFLVRRFDYIENGAKKKTFRQFTFLSDGNIKTGVQGVELLPYRIDEVAASIRQGQPVVLCEGEKDADLVRSCWLTATCNPMGAGKWRESYNKYFQGADVVILPDGDQVGLKHALQVYENLQPIARGIRIKILPEGIHDAGDLVENLRAEGVVEKAAKERILALPDWEIDDLRVAAGVKVGPEEEVVNQKKYSLSPVTVFTAAEILKQEFGPVEYIVRELLPACGLTLLVGRSKAGKSWLTLWLARAVAIGESFMNFFLVDRQCRTLIMALEDSDRKIHPRLKQVGIRADMDIDFTFQSPTGEKGLSSLCQLIETQHPNLVIIDTLQCFTGTRSGKGTNAYEADYGVIKNIKDVAYRYQVAILLTHHPRKGEVDQANPHDSINGSTGLMAAADTVWLLDRSSTKSKGTLYTVGREIEQRAWDVTFEERQWRCDGEREECLETETRRQIFQVVKNSTDPLTASQIIAAIHDEGIRKSAWTIRTAIRRMTDSNQLVKRDLGYILP